MRRTFEMGIAAAVLCAAACKTAVADDENPGKGTWKIDASAQPAKVAKGDKGKVALAIVTVPGVKVSAEAPLKIKLQALGLKLDKSTLVQTDALDAKSGHPRFEIPFVAEQPGAHSVDADLTFFVCTEKWCVRQKDKVSVKVEVQ